MVKCTKCSKTFVDVQRMQQHLRDAHSGKQKAVKAKPTRVAKPKASSSGMGRLSDSGVDLLNQTNILSGKTTNGTKLFSIPLAPGYFKGRLGQEVSIWERWRPRSLTVEVICSGSAMTFGSLVVGWSADEAFRLTDTNFDSTRVLALKPSKVFRANDTGRITIPASTLTKWYLVHSHVGESHGSVHAVVLNPFGGYSGSFGVTCVMHWHIDFEGVSLQSLASPISDIIYADIGFDGPFFTTSDSSFNSEILTFKEHSGGAMVPFQTARAGVVYKSALPNQQVYYYDAAGVQRVAAYFSVLPAAEYATPGLVMFASVDDASAFVRTGDISKCLKYTKAGEWCKPDRLGFIAVSTSSVSVSGAEDLENKIDSLKLQLLQLESLRAPPVTHHLVKDDSVRFHLENYRKDWKKDTSSRPPGTLSSPQRVFVVDPVPLGEAVRAVETDVEEHSTSSFEFA